MKLNIVMGFFLPVPPVAGGATEKIWHRLAEIFAVQGHQVTVCSRHWPGFPPRETLAGVTHLRVRGHDHSRSLARNLWHDFRWSVRVARALPPAEVTICNSVTLPIWLPRMGSARGRVVAVMARMPKGQTRFYGGVDRVFSLSEAVTRQIHAENPDLRKRIVPFPYPIDWPLHAAARLRRSEGPVTIGYVGRIHPEKGVDLLAAAVERLVQRTDLPAWRLEMIGPWDIPRGGGGETYRRQLMSRLTAALETRFTFREAEFNPEKLARIYGALDVFCYPSEADTGETFGVAVAEAMAARCVPVVSNLACFRDFVQDGVNGLVFPLGGRDPAGGLADALARLLLDAGYRDTLSERAQEVVRRYDYAKSAQAVLTHLAELVATKRGARS